MNRFVRFANSAVIIVVFACAQQAVASEVAAASPTSCNAAEFRQLDFWIGDWDVFESDGVTKAAHARVDGILDGCALRERYEDPTGLKRESTSTYDALRKVWRQTWVTNRGQSLTIEGRMEDGQLVLSGADRTPSGAARLVRGTWKQVDGGVRHIAVTSTDNGKSWKPWFDRMFRPRAAAVALEQEKKTLFDLDTQYQAAVKENDPATIDRIVHDDFEIVTGRGRVFNKANLLEDARTKSATYEHQEDTEKSVRIWGDCAVVTAKLWAKGTGDGKEFDYKLWFSDLYVRTPDGWKYLFAQSSIPLPKDTP